MKLSTTKVDPKAIEDGDWIENLPEMDDLKLKARGQSSMAYRAVQRKELNKLPRNVRNLPDGLPLAIQDRITNKCLVDAGILDWQNMELDDGIKPFSKELLEQLVNDPVSQVFREACIVATVRVGAIVAKADEELLGNSASSSDGNSATAGAPTG